VPIWISFPTLDWGRITTQESHVYLGILWQRRTFLVQLRFCPNENVQVIRWMETKKVLKTKHEKGVKVGAPDARHYYHAMLQDFLSYYHDGWLRVKFASTIRCKAWRKGPTVARGTSEACRRRISWRSCSADCREAALEFCADPPCIENRVKTLVTLASLWTQNTWSWPKHRHAIVMIYSRKNTLARTHKIREHFQSMQWVR
jgi:hypothetical protein